MVSSKRGLVTRGRHQAKMERSRPARWGELEMCRANRAYVRRSVTVDDNDGPISRGRGHGGRGLSRAAMGRLRRAIHWLRSGTRHCARVHVEKREGGHTPQLVLGYRLDWPGIRTTGLANHVARRHKTRFKGAVVASKLAVAMHKPRRPFVMQLEAGGMGKRRLCRMHVRAPEISSTH